MIIPVPKFFPFSHPAGFLSLAAVPSENVLHIAKYPAYTEKESDLTLCGDSEGWRISLEWPACPVEGEMCPHCTGIQRWLNRQLRRY